jgi:hypothetical protein
MLQDYPGHSKRLLQREYEIKRSKQGIRAFKKGSGGQKKGEEGESYDKSGKEKDDRAIKIFGSGAASVKTGLIEGDRI